MFNPEDWPSSPNELIDSIDGDIEFDKKFAAKIRSRLDKNFPDNRLLAAIADDDRDAFLAELDSTPPLELEISRTDLPFLDALVQTNDDWLSVKSIADQVFRHQPNNDQVTLSDIEVWLQKAISKELAINRTRNIKSSAVRRTGLSSQNQFRLAISPLRLFIQVCLPFKEQGIARAEMFAVGQRWNIPEAVAVAILDKYGF